MPFLSPDFWRDLISLAYLSIAAIIILLVVVGLVRAKPKDKRTWRLVPLVAAVVFAPGGWLKFQKWQADQEWAQKQSAQIAHFEMRCKSAGEKIYQTVKGVEGIFIMKPRVVPDESHYQDQFGLWDPYGTSKTEARHPSIIFLHTYKEIAESTRTRPVVYGYRFIETLNPEHAKDKTKPQFVRYAYQRDGNDQIVRKDDSWKTPVEESRFEVELKSQYGYTWDDISTKEDREKWIAGGRLQIVELATAKVIAERIGYMREPGMGHKQFDRLTWLFAEKYACPEIDDTYGKDRSLLNKVIPSN